MDDRKKYEEAVLGTCGVMGCYDDEGFSLYSINGRMLSYLGYETEEEFRSAISGSFANAMEPGDLDKSSLSVHQQLEKGPDYEIAYRVRRKDGTYIWIEERGHKILTADGRTLLMAICFDMTLRMEEQMLDELAREKAARRHFERELAYQKAAQGENLLVKVRMNLSRNMVEHVVSKSVVTSVHVGMSYDDVAAILSAGAVTQEQKGQITALFNRARLVQNFEEGICRYKIIYQRRMRNGRIQWVETTLNLYRNMDTGEVLSFDYTYDIDREQTMQLILGRIADLDYEYITLVDRETRWLTCVQYRDMMDDSLDTGSGDYHAMTTEFVEKHVAEESREEVRQALDFDHVLAHLEEEPTYSFSDYVVIGGRQLRKKWEFSYMDESRTTVLFVLSDITAVFRQQEQQQEKMKQAWLAAEQANRAKSDFLSRMSHEIRTPLNAIIGMNALAMENMDDARDVEDCLGKVDASARFLLSLINDILEMSRIESGTMKLLCQPFSLKAMIESVNGIIANQAGSRGLDYRCVVVPKTNLAYKGDAMKIKQILLNLLGNAVKFTPSGGWVRLIIHQDGVMGNKARMRFTVKDSGIGLGKDFIGRMYEPFEQEDGGMGASQSGTGLGLSICKSLVDMMGGQIYVNSVKGEGTTFNVVLDLEMDDSETDGAGWDSSANTNYDWDFSGRRMLLVEDHALNVEVARRLLERKGAAVEVVGNGQDAVDKIGACPQGTYDIVLMDIRMPVMDGLTATRTIRRMEKEEKRRVRVPIVAMSANAFDEDVEKSMAAGMDGHLAKPIDPAIMYAVLDEVLKDK